MNVFFVQSVRTFTLKDVPEYLGKQMDSGDLTIFFLNRSLLFRKMMMEVSLNHLLLQMESKSFRDSCMRFCRREVGAGQLGHKKHLTDVQTVKQTIRRGVRADSGAARTSQSREENRKCSS